MGVSQVQHTIAFLAHGLFSGIAVVRRLSSRTDVSVSPAFGRAVAARPRYLVHGSILAVGALAIGVVAAQPRQAPVTELSLSEEPVLALMAEPMLAVDPAPPAPEPAPAAPVAAANAEPAVRTHVVEGGESIRMLAATYGVSPETIMAANSITQPDRIQVGQELVIPPGNGVLYRLRAGEMLRQVAERYSVDLGEVLAANQLETNPDLVAEGTEVFLPGATPLVQAPGSSATAAEGQQMAATLSGGALVPVGAAARSAAPSSRTYEVQPGDSLRGIADVFGVDVDTILASNGIEDPDTIRPGTELRILPVKGVEYEVQANETLADVAWRYQVDLGLLLDYNDLSNPDVIRVGSKLLVPGGTLRADAATASPAPALSAPEEAAVPAPRVALAAAPAPVVAAPAAKPAPKPAAPAVAAPAPKPAPKPETAPAAASGGGASVVAKAMQYVGYPYVWGGTSPAGFDCSGFVYYVLKTTGNPVGRGMWEQFNGGPRVTAEDLQPGDAVFFANTYMPGLSHSGIYIGGGQFVNAGDESTGVTVSNMNSSYWSSRFVTGVRLWD